MPKRTESQTNKYTLRFYWEQMRLFKTSFFLALVCIPTGAILIDTLLPYFFSQAIGGLAGNDQADVWRNVWLAATFGIIGSLSNFIGFQTLTRHEANAQKELMAQTFMRLVRKDMSFFVNEKVGALTGRFIDFNRSRTTLQDLFIIRTLGFVSSVSIGLTIVAFQSWVLALIILSLIVCLIAQVRWSIKRRAPLRHERKELTSEINGRVADSLTNSLVIKTFAGEQREINYLTEKTKRYKEVFIKDIGFLSKEGSARVAFMVLIQIIAISACTYLVLERGLDIAIAIFTLTYLQRLASQIFSLGDILNGYDQALLEAAPMSDILAKKTTVQDTPNASVMRNITPSITFKEVGYRYSDGAEDVLQNISISIKAGEKVGLVGHSGSGKTTITHLLLRFSDVTNGAILVDTFDVREVTQQSLRETIAYVPQEPMLFHRSLRDNIAYGKPNATDTEIEQAARQANAIEFIEKLPKKFDTLVGERGIKLSGGQRQRIAIARALLKDAPILVLDEATSALDSESEKLIQDALEKLMKGRTSIVVAHRLSTIAHLDRIVVLDKGKIVEDAPHKELLKQKGIYAKLWAHQSGGFIEE